MKLSEAMRLGSMLRPQAFFPCLRDNRSCALEAAAEAVGLHSYMSAIGKYWPWAHEHIHKCPECWHPAIVTYTIAFHLNDKHRWTREQIADWVATVEPQGESQAVAVAPVVERTAVRV